MRKTDNGRCCGLSRWWNSSRTKPSFLPDVLSQDPYEANSILRNPSFSADVLCRHFKFTEIQQATNNFDDALLIGQGGFGNVYMGYIDGGNTTVAIKRWRKESHQGGNEFKTEIELLSQLRHRNVVSLIGYYSDKVEMIVVYDFMINGNFRDHLYGTNNDPLPWKRRLEICIGAAKGLHYLHEGAKHKIIHRDVKSTNILLDEKWMAIITDFGLSKMAWSNTGDTHVSTAVKGAFGYLDPEYFRRMKLTEKSDVYSFGVVLFEALCARRVIDSSLDRNQVNLVSWVQTCIRNGTLDKIIDPHLIGNIAPACLKEFADIANSCVRDRGIERPTMANVVQSLEFVMQLQESADAANEPQSGCIYQELSFCESSSAAQNDDVVSSQGGSSGHGSDSDSDSANSLHEAIMVEDNL